MSSSSMQSSSSSSRLSSQMQSSSSSSSFSSQSAPNSNDSSKMQVVDLKEAGLTPNTTFTLENIEDHGGLPPTVWEVRQGRDGRCYMNLVEVLPDTNGVSREAKPDRWTVVKRISNFMGTVPALAALHDSFLKGVSKSVEGVSDESEKAKRVQCFLRFDHFKLVFGKTNGKAHKVTDLVYQPEKAAAHFMPVGLGGGQSLSSGAAASASKKKPKASDVQAERRGQPKRRVKKKPVKQEGSDLSAMEDSESGSGSSQKRRRERDEEKSSSKRRKGVKGVKSESESESESEKDLRMPAYSSSGPFSALLLAANAVPRRDGALSSSSSASAPLADHVTPPSSTGSVLRHLSATPAKPSASVSSSVAFSSSDSSRLAPGPAVKPSLSLSRSSISSSSAPAVTPTPT